MIVCRLAGSLGDQMFQYACGRALAERYGTMMQFDLTELSNRKKREFQLDQWRLPDTPFFDIHAVRRISFSLGQLYSIPLPHPQCLFRSPLRRLLRCYYRNWTMVVENTPGHYQKLLLENPQKTSVILKGDWQSETYFSDIENSVREHFTLREELSESDRLLAAEMQKNPASVSVDIRCGGCEENFKIWCDHYVCTPKYYADAFRRIAGQLAPGQPHFYIFSDHPEWVQNNIELPPRHTLVSNRQRQEAHGITVFSRCHHHIIANRSFSWWGAWLNPDKGKTVLTPSRWFNDGNPGPDIVPPQWTRCPEDENSDRDYLDRPFAEKRYLQSFGRALKLDPPVSLTEKMQWLKLYHRDTQQTLLCDKLAVREYVREKIGPQYLNELIASYESAEEIDFAALPNAFVLKATHGSDWNILCPDKRRLDQADARRQLRRWLNTNYYYSGREWNYKHVPPRIICEAYISSRDPGGLRDYKVWCFNGKPKYIQVDIGRYTSRHTRALYDIHWRRQEFSIVYPQYAHEVPRPGKLDELLELAEKLAERLILARMDFYIVESRLIFGEITFFDGNGFGAFWSEGNEHRLEEFDNRLGGELILPTDSRA